MTCDAFEGGQQRARGRTGRTRRPRDGASHARVGVAEQASSESLGAVPPASGVGRAVRAELLVGLALYHVWVALELPGVAG